MALTHEQKKFFEENGYLKYDRRVLTEEELSSLRRRSEEVVTGRLTHVPPRFIQLEAKFRSGEEQTAEGLDRVRKITHLCYFDEVFERVARKSEVVDVIEDLLGPDIKLYADQLMMKPRFHGTVTDWHQDAPAWPFLIPQDHVSCWIALDDAKVENGCMIVIPGSHRWGPVATEFKKRFLSDPDLCQPVPVEIQAGYCMFHHALNFHRTGANPTPNRRRGLALHYMRSQTKYLGLENEEARLLTECEKPRGTFRFMLIRGREFTGRV
ncbi:MAG: phytanoyl-CoA dioxygenase family protein [Planctomycetes bacterium]|nr:phytanoyl-CoA dioxygenase family protein [Planctomycetota bacterium]